MIVGDPIEKDCIVCGALYGHPCHDLLGEFLDNTHIQRGRVLTGGSEWMRKYDGLYRVMPEGGFFGGEHGG